MQKASLLVTELRNLRKSLFHWFTNIPWYQQVNYGNLFLLAPEDLHCSYTLPGEGMEQFSLMKISRSKIVPSLLYIWQTSWLWNENSFCSYISLLYSSQWFVRQSVEATQRDEKDDQWRKSIYETSTYISPCIQDVALLPKDIYGASYSLLNHVIATYHS